MRLDRYYVELGLGPNETVPNSGRAPFDGAMCDLVLEFRPEVVSFHFGLPDEELLARVKATGAKVISSATSADEARWLEGRGCNAIIAQGFEAGGHRGMFLTEDISTQVGTMALVPQVVDAVQVPVIAAGGIADARGIVAAFALGASAVQVGTAYLFCPEAKLGARHREARRKRPGQRDGAHERLQRPSRTGDRQPPRPGGWSHVRARPGVPARRRRGGAFRARSEPTGSVDFIPLWSGQAAHLCRELPAGELTRRLAAEALAKLAALGGNSGGPRMPGEGRSS